MIADRPVVTGLGLPGLAARLAELAATLAPAHAPRRGMPPGPAPLERTDRSPRVWVSAQARRSRVDAGRLAQAVSADPGLPEAVALPTGLVELSLPHAALVEMLAGLAGGATLADAAAAPTPEPGCDVARFEGARIGGARFVAGMTPTAPGGLARRTLDTPLVLVQLAHSRAARAVQATRDEPGCDRVEVLPADAPDLDPQEAALVTELLDAPRRLAQHPTRPHEVVTALTGVAAAYLAWVERPARQVRAAARVPGSVGVDAPTRAVLERGLALLGVHAPERM